MSPEASKCSVCGASGQAGRDACSYCGNPLVWEGAGPPAPNRSVEEAATAWGRTIPGAPRKLGRLVRSVVVQDEMIDRLLTTVVRREVQEVRGRGPSGAPYPARIDFRAVDPFSISPEQLRAASQHVTTCAVCGGSGTAVCRGCAGSGRAQCGNCCGSGKERRYYKNSSRLVKCSVCRGGATVACGGCGARGAVGCDGCGATGNQLAWLTYGEASRAMLFVTESAVVSGHPQLKEHRRLVSADLSEFGLVVANETSGAFPDDQRAPSALLQGHRRATDHRLERVTSQQYLRLAVIRRDAVFEMCGMSGTLVLSGNELLVSSDADLRVPITTRRMFAIVGTIVAFVIWVAVVAREHPEVYFAAANAWASALALGAAAITYPALSILLRQLRPRLRFGGFSSFEKGLLAAVPTAFVLALLIPMLVRPRVSEVEGALAANNVARARIVLDALHAARPAPSALADIEDKVELAEARAKPLDTRLATLDGVAARRRTLAGEAARLARADRLGAITASLAAGNTRAALQSIAAWFPKVATDSEVAALAARAHEQVFAGCADVACRYAAADRANRAAPNAARAQQAATAKAALLESLEVRPVAGETLAARLGRLRQIISNARAAKEAALEDTEVATRAEKVVLQAQRERDAVALLGAQEATVQELLGPLTRKTDTISYNEASSRLAYVIFDAQRRCRGLYVVGAQPKARALNGSASVALLAQAVGKPAALKMPNDNQSITRWVENGVGVVARWSAHALIELRIGDASP